MECISIIIPVYNVEIYIDQCVKSIVNQTYSNLEILLINDGSTDYSGEKCKKWASIDDRIKYISKTNEGLGPTRNLGIEKATGEYVCFVDSDDWIDHQFVEIMYKKLKDENAELVFCDFYRWYNEDIMKKFGGNASCLGKEFSLAERLLTTTGPIWNILVRRNIFTAYNIYMHNTKGEDFTVIAALILCARKITSVDKGLYYYRQNRKGSICATKSVDHIFTAAAGSIDNLKKNGLLKEYMVDIFKHITLMFERVFTGENVWDKDEYHRLWKKMVLFLKNTFYEYPVFKIALLGGNNLNRIIQKTQYLGLPYLRFNFSSIISLTSVVNVTKDLKIKHNNKYRENMIQRDFLKSFKSIIEEEKPTYIFIDFIEERHDLIFADGVYYTKSDAFDEVLTNDFEYEVISRFSDECNVLWEKSCLMFIDFLKDNFSDKKVVLIENYLAEKHGDFDHKEYFSDIIKIQKTNALLNKYYCFFNGHYAEASKISFSNDELYFTDENYIYGRYPWHLNEHMNFKIANCLKDI